MGKKKMKGSLTDDGDEDRISSLPGSLIHHILSFLVMRDVIRTCLLSRRWRNIWKSVPVLKFERWCREEFIDQSLIRYEGQKVQKFHLDFDGRNDASRLESWFRFAVMHGVEELDVKMPSNSFDYMLPSCLFECLEMRVLRLSFYDSTPRPFHFPLLAELHFRRFSLQKLDTSACPLLESLIIEEVYTFGSLEIYAPNLKLRYLKISESDYNCCSNITLYAPSVLHFDFEGSFQRFYEFTDISSVKTLSLESTVEPDDYRMAESLVKLIKYLTHVKSLKLCQWCIQLLACGETIGLEIPSLSATCLKLETNLSKFLLVGITSLLRASRCIERLIINMKEFTLPDEMIFKDRDIDAIKAWESLEHVLSVNLALNTILIQNYPGRHHYWREHNMDKLLEYCDFEIKLVEVILKSSKILNKMSISIMKPDSYPLKFQLLYDLTKTLIVFPRSSINAEVHIS